MEVKNLKRKGIGLSIAFVLIVAAIITASYMQANSDTVIKAKNDESYNRQITKVEEEPSKVTDQKTLNKYNLLTNWQAFHGFPQGWTQNNHWNGSTNETIVPNADGGWRGDGAAKILENRGIRFDTTGVLAKRILVKSTIPVIQGHYYQLSTKITSDGFDGTKALTAMDWLSNSDINNPVSIFPDYSAITIKAYDISITKILKAATNEMTFTFSTAASTDRVYTSAFFTDLTVVDLNQGIVEAQNSLEKLFTNSTHSEIKLATTQQEIDKTKNLIDTVVNSIVNDQLTKELAKAQALLDKITMSLTIPNDLVNDPRNELSHTISGKTYPNSFLHFSGTPLFPKGTLSSEVSMDSKLYQIRANGQGEFSYSLPKASYFDYGSTITVTSMLRGKFSVQTKVVRDIVPPDKPVLDPLKDVADVISGIAETGSTVRITDVITGTELLKGIAGSDNRFSFMIPKDKRPLVPYKKYSALATDVSGNKSLLSDSQEVSDTTAPKAEPIKQTLQIGDPLPKIDQLLKNVSDNAGTDADNLTIKMTKVPNMSISGYQTAEITLTDRAKNQLVATVPIVIKDKETLIDEKNLLQVSSFSVLTIDYPETIEEQRSFLLKHAKAWDVPSGQELTEKIMINKGSLIKQPGVYEVSFSIGSLTKKIKITLLEGNLAFDRATEMISFGTNTIQSKKQYLSTENKLSIVVHDTRFVASKWRLMAKLNHPLKTKDDIVSTSKFIYRSYDLNGSVMDKTINHLGVTEVYRAEKVENGLIQVDFTREKKKEVILKVVPGSVRSDKEYFAQIIWTIEDGP